jgi:multidrug efflux pump subunit AcrA (membrane-fusion protein)
LKFDLASIEEALEKGLEYVQALAPLAGVFGPAAGAIGQTVSTIAAGAKAVLDEIEADVEVIASGDLDRIRALQAQLQAENAALGAQIAAS